MSRMKVLIVAVGMTGILTIMGAFVDSVQARPSLGSLDLNGYCQSLGFARATLTEPQIGENAACDPNHSINHNWYCVDDRPPAARIDMTDACEFQYDQSDLTAWPLHPHDAFTWQCYTVP